MKYFVFTVLLLIFNHNFTYSDDNTDNISLSPKEKLILLLNEKKDPYIAGILSIIYSGIGQFYCGRYPEGSLLFLGETLVYLYNFGITLKLKNTYENTNLKFSSLDFSDQILLGSSYLLYLTIKIISIYNAYQIANEINQDIDNQIKLLEFTFNEKSWNLLCYYKF